MILLADNDILLKLARCDLFKEFLAGFAITVEDCRILQTARYVLTSTRIRKRLDERSYARLTAFLDIVKDIDIAPDPLEMAALVEQPRIDAGEAVLFSVCRGSPESILVTGDKRSLTSLSEAAGGDAICRTLFAALTGRVACFEQDLLRILDHGGFDPIRDKIIGGRESDKTLTNIIGSGLDTTEAVLREGLNSYIGDLRKNTGSLLTE